MRDRGTNSCQQFLYETEPLRIERLPAHRLFRPAIPVLRIALITFLAMQVGVNPRPFDALVPLGGLVCPPPIALAIPPQTSERVRESVWQFGRYERLAKVVYGHSEIPAVDFLIVGCSTRIWQLWREP